MQAGQTDEEEVKQQQRTEVLKIMTCGQRTGSIRKPVDGLVNCWWLGVKKAWFDPRIRKYDAAAVRLAPRKELTEVAEKVLTVRMEVELKGLKLSITEGGKEWKSKVIVSCRYLEEKFHKCSK